MIRFTFLLFFICFATSCVAESDADKATALMSKPLTPSAEITELFDHIEHLLDSNDDSTHAVSRKHCRELLAQAKARYGDTKNSADMFNKQIKELDTAKLELAEKENAFGDILLKMSQAGLAPEAIRKAEASSSPTVQALAPCILGQLQFMDAQHNDSSTSFMGALTQLKVAPESPLKSRIIFEIVSLASMNDSMLNVLLFAEEHVPKKERMFDDVFERTFALAWCKVHKDDLAAGKFEPFLKRAEAETTDSAQAEYVRAVIKAQIKRGQFADVPKTIDRIFPPGAEKKKVAADVAAIFGRFDGRDLCLETLAISYTQHGKLAEAMTIADSIEELQRRDAAVNKMIGVLTGKDVKATVLYGLVSDTMLGGDTPDEGIPTPKYSEAELLKFCRWYAATSEQFPYLNAKIQRTASAAGLMSQFGFKKEAEELFDKAFADVLTIERKEVRIYAVEPIINHRIGSGDFDVVLDLIENKFPANDIKVPDYQKIIWFCAMKKFNEAIALLEEEKASDFDLAQIGSALIADDRSEDAKKLFEKTLAEAFASEKTFSARMLPINLLQVGMTDEAFRCAERFYNDESKSQMLVGLAWQQRKDGNAADADKTLVKAIKQVEKMEAKHDGNRHGLIKSILRQLATDMK